jgi:cyclopropane-fatty-acyl-phospholipid synthase
LRNRSGETAFRKLLEPADIQINGSRPWDIQVHKSDFFDRILAGGSLALGESYIEKWWDCSALDQLFERILRKRLDQQVKKPIPLFRVFLRSWIKTAFRKGDAYQIGSHHYDLGNDLFKVMLDPWMNYSCGYWNNANDLDEAQEARLDLTCRKLQLEPGMQVLDIGCGWGGFAKYAADKYQIRVSGVTVSRRQVEFARTFCEGLPVEIEYLDYRSLKDRTFDRIVSIGMFEHVGVSNYPTYMRTIHRCLKPEGLFLLQTIAGNRSTDSDDPGIGKYMESAQQSARAIGYVSTMVDRRRYIPEINDKPVFWMMIPYIKSGFI